MYRILGADNKEYGPVPSEVIRRWIAERRLDARSMVRREGETDWKRLAEFPEFQSAHGAAPPLSGFTPPTPAPAPAGDGMTLAGGRRTSGAAITALILGILAPCTLGIAGLPGAIFGIVALKRIGASAGRLGGKGLATTGLVLSLIFLVSLPPLFVASLIANKRMQGNFGVPNPTTECIGHIQQLANAVRTYANDNNDRFPPATWCDAIQSGVSGLTTFQCPATPGLRCGYAMNAALAGKIRYEVAPDTVLLFESDQGWNGTGNASAVISSSRHGLISVVLADGSVRSIRAENASSLRWTP